MEGVLPGVELEGDASILRNKRMHGFERGVPYRPCSLRLVHVDILLLGLDLSGPCGYFKPNGLTL